MVEEYGICPNCGHEIEEGSKFCNECGTQLEWKEDEVCFPPKPEQNGMREGNIKCDCGQVFYYETVRDTIYCINCNKRYDVGNYPGKKENIKETAEEGEGDEA